MDTYNLPSLSREKDLQGETKSSIFENTAIELPGYSNQKQEKFKKGVNERSKHNVSK
jgi:hypothetical protein